MTNDSAATISSKFYFPYSRVNKMLNEYKSTKIFPQRGLIEEVKKIEPNNIISEVIKDYWAISDIWFSSHDIVTEIK